MLVIFMVRASTFAANFTQTNTMQHAISQCLRFCALLSLFLFFACRTQPAGPWADFVRCGTNACVKEALAVKDALIKDPKTTLGQFDETYQKGEDHVVGWLQLMRDSVLFADKYGTTEQRFAMQQAIIEAARPYENDPKLGEMAKSVIGELEGLAIASELEDDIVEHYAPLTGSYAYTMPKDAGSGTLKISALDGEHFHFGLEVIAGPPAYNQGTMEGEAMLTAPGVFEFKTSEYVGTCRLQFTVDGDNIVIKTLEGDDAACGFGHNVRADQTYRRSSFDDPFLKPAEAKTAKNLRGQWVSTSDPESEIKLDKGMYTEVYQGKEQSSLPYQYFPVCPKDCNPAGKFPCLKVMGQDDVCYAVVKADGKTLELSMVGGRGNTLAFKKK